LLLAKFPLEIAQDGERHAPRGRPPLFKGKLTTDLSARRRK
jgi:hypothetical protein